jgi:hypothetical protein
LHYGSPCFSSSENNDLLILIVPVSVGPQVACKVGVGHVLPNVGSDAVQPAVFAQAARSESTMKSRVIGTASRLVDNSI